MERVASHGEVMWREEVVLCALDWYSVVSG